MDTQTNKPKNRRTTAFLALLFGPLGVHEFYLHNKTAGIAHLVFTLFMTSLSALIQSNIPFAAMLIVVELEALKLALINDDEFQAQYIERSRLFL